MLNEAMARWELHKVPDSRIVSTCLHPSILRDFFRIIYDNLLNYISIYIYIYIYIVIYIYVDICSNICSIDLLLHEWQTMSSDSKRAWLKCVLLFRL